MLLSIIIWQNFVWLFKTWGIIHKVNIISISHDPFIYPTLEVILYLDVKWLNSIWTIIPIKKLNYIYATRPPGEGEHFMLFCDTSSNKIAWILHRHLLHFYIRSFDSHAAIYFLCILYECIAAFFNLGLVAQTYGCKMIQLFTYIFSFWPKRYWRVRRRRNW